MSFAKVEAPVVEFRQVGDEQHRRLSLTRREALNARDDNVVGEPSYGREQGRVHG
jgi:hypothetical protein